MLPIDSSKTVDSFKNSHVIHTGMAEYQNIVQYSGIAKNNFFQKIFEAVGCTCHACPEFSESFCRCRSPRVRLYGPTYSCTIDTWHCTVCIDTVVSRFWNLRCSAQVDSRNLNSRWFFLKAYRCGPLYDKVAYTYLCRVHTHGVLSAHGIKGWTNETAREPRSLYWEPRSNQIHNWMIILLCKTWDWHF